MHLDQGADQHVHQDADQLIDRAADQRIDRGADQLIDRAADQRIDATALTPTQPRRRADAVRNRDRIVASARIVFAAGGETGPEAVARHAGVGIGTLYRNFPDRSALAAAVYADELREVAQSADALLAESTPLVALRTWMDRFATRFENKRAMAPALQSLTAPATTSDELKEHTRAELSAAVEKILIAGEAAGDFARNARADDLVVALVGACMACRTAESRPQLDRIFDLLVASVRVTG